MKILTKEGKNIAIIFIGIQATGKTSFYNKYFKDDFVHINLDTLHTRNKENILLEQCFNNKHNFVIDNTNPTKKDREKYIVKAKQNNFYVIGYFFKSCIDECIERNNNRTGKANIPTKAIIATSNKLELPGYEEGFDELNFVYINNGEFIIDKWRDNNEI